MEDNNDMFEFIRNGFCVKRKVDERIAKEFFLSAIDINILTFIYLYPVKTTATDIEMSRNIKKNTISIHVENLVQMGLVERKELRDDRRKIVLILTDKAKGIAKKCLAEYKNLEKQLREGISDEQIEIFQKSVEIFNQNAKKILSKME